MRQPHQAEPGVIKPVEIVEIAVQRMPALGPEDAADDMLPRRAPRQNRVQIGAGLHDLQHLWRLFLGQMQLPRLFQRAFGQVQPAAERAELADVKQGDIVPRVGGVLGVVQPGGAFRDRGEDLKRHIALDQPGQIDLTAIGSLRQVAVPKQAVGMPVPDDEARVQRLCRRADRPGIMRRHRVLLAFDIARREGEEPQKPEHDQGADQPQDQPHHPSFSRIPVRTRGSDAPHTASGSTARQDRAGRPARKAPEKG